MRIVYSGCLLLASGAISAGGCSSGSDSSETRHSHRDKGVNVTCFDLEDYPSQANQIALFCDYGAVSGAQ